MNGTLRLFAGSIQADVSSRAQGLSVETNRIGFSMPLQIERDAWLFTAQLVVAIFDNGIERRAYRLNRPALSGEALRFEGLSKRDAFNDLLYTEFWSSTRLDTWEVIPENIVLGWRPDMWAMSANASGLRIGPVKGTTYNTGGMTAAGFTLALPLSTNRSIVAVRIVFKFVYTGTQSFDVYVDGVKDDYTGGSNILAGNLPGVGGPGSVEFPLTYIVTDPDVVRLLFWIRTTSPLVATYTNETGDNYAQISSIRVVTGGEIINTTAVTGALTVGSNTITPASMANIEVGSVLSFADTEEVTVTSKTASTFTANFINNYVGGTRTIKAIAGVYAGTILKDMIGEINTTNPGQLSGATMLIDRGLDQTEAFYTLAQMRPLVEKFASEANYQLAVDGNGVVAFRESLSERTFLIRTSNIELVRPAEEVRNAITVQYQTTNNKAAYTNEAVSAFGVAQLGITRQELVQVSTTSPAVAEAVRDATLAIKQDRPVQSRYRIDRVFNRWGQPARVSDVRRGDRIVLASLPTYLTTSDRDREIVVDDVRYDPVNDRIEVTPRDLLPTIDVLLAAR